MSCEIVCKLRLENDPRHYDSNDIEQILQSSVKRKPKWQRQCYQHFTNQNKLDRILSNKPIECVLETESAIRELSHCRINAYSVENTLQTIYFKYSTIILFDTNCFMIF